jgi:hypothetical protein
MFWHRMFVQPELEYAATTADSKLPSKYMYALFVSALFNKVGVGGVQVLPPGGPVDEHDDMTWN